MDLVLTRGREGVQNLENLADVICASPLTKPIPCMNSAIAAASPDAPAPTTATDTSIGFVILEIQVSDNYSQLNS